MGSGMQLRLFFFSETFNPRWIETMIAGQMVPIRRTINARFGYVDGWKPFAKFADAEASEPFACRSAFARTADRVRSTRLVIFNAVFLKGFAATTANIVRHGALFQIASRTPIIFASLSVNGKCDS